MKRAPLQIHLLFPDRSTVRRAVNRRHGIILCSLFLLSLLNVPPTRSAWGLTLKEARDEAIQKYWGIKIAGEQVVIAESERKSRYADFFPKLLINGTVARNSDESEFLLKRGAVPNSFTTFPATDTLFQITNRTVYQFGPALQQPVFVGGRLYYRFRESQSQEEEASWNKKNMLNDLVYSVELAYLAVLQAQGEKGVREKNLDFFKRLHLDVQKKYDAGRITLDDVLRVQFEVTRAEEKLLAATSDLELRKGKLNLLLVRPVDAPVSLEAVSDPAPLEIDLKMALAIAQSRRPDLRRMGAALNAAEFNTQTVRSAYYPQIHSGARWYREDVSPSTPERDRWQLFLTADWSIWEWGSTKQRVAAAKAQARKAEYRVKELSDQIQLEVHEAWLMIKGSEKQIQVAARGIEHTEENLRVMKLGFEAGVKTLTNLIQAEALLSEAELSTLRARFSAQIARATLLHTVGVMEEEDLAGPEINPAAGKNQP